MTTSSGPSAPPGLRERVLAASRARRGSGRSLPEAPGISGVEAFGRAADALFELLCGLDEADWRRPTVRNLDVQGLIGHLVGVEDDVQRALAGDPDVAAADHVLSTQPAAMRQSRLSPPQTRGVWRAAVDRTTAAVRGPDVPRVPVVHGIRLPLDELLVVRAFELWTHENDIRRATGRTARVPDLPTLRRMTELAVRLLPYGVARAAPRRGSFALHLVLTGGGGGTWDMVLGEPQDDGAVPEVAIVADAVDFCRLVAARVEPAELALHVTGAAHRTADVVAGAAALALD